MTLAENVVSNTPNINELNSSEDPVIVYADQKPCMEWI